jgi:hypothetical protein
MGATDGLGNEDKKRKYGSANHAALVGEWASGANCTILRHAVLAMKDSGRRDRPRLTGNIPSVGTVEVNSKRKESRI